MICLLSAYLFCKNGPCSSFFVVTEAGLGFTFCRSLALLQPLQDLFSDGNVLVIVACEGFRFIR